MARDFSNEKAHWLWLMFAAMGWLIPFLTQAAQTDPPPEITSFQQFRGLRPDQAREGRAVRLRGTVVCFDAGWNQLYVHDGHETGYFSPQPFRTQPMAGQLVEITGITTFLEGNNAYTNLELRVLGPRSLPQAKRLELSQLAGEFGQWIETRGRVRVAETSWGRLALVLHEKGQSCLVFVMGQPKTNQFKEWLGRTVRVRGINASRAVGGRLESASVTLPGIEELAVIEESQGAPLAGPVVSVGSLRTRELGPWTNNPIHLHGLIAFNDPSRPVQSGNPGICRSTVAGAFD